MVLTKDIEINSVLARLGRQTNDLHPTFDEIGQTLVSHIQTHLGRGETPWGEAFSVLKATRGRHPAPAHLQ